MRAALLLALVLLAGCSTLTPWLVPGEQPQRLVGAEHRDYRIVADESVRPILPLYRDAYDQMVRCVGEDAYDVPFGAIQWLHADSLVSRESGRAMAGIALPRINRIYYARPWRGDPRVVGHEILHLLLPFSTHLSGEFRACDPRSWS